MYLKIKCTHHNLSDSFKKNMKEYLGLEQIQSYFPIIENTPIVFRIHSEPRLLDGLLLLVRGSCRPL